MQYESVRGLHLVADIAGASGLGDLPLIEAVLREAAQAARATVLDVRLHHFGPGKGVTGVALLAESHISIHTWPEHGLAAVDIVFCGAASDAHAGLAVLENRLGGAVVLEREIVRLQTKSG